MDRMFELNICFWNQVAGYCNENPAWGRKTLEWSKLADYTVNGKFQMEIIAKIDHDSLFIETLDPHYCQKFKVEVELPKHELANCETIFKSEPQEIAGLPW